MINPFQNISTKNQKKLLWLLESKTRHFTENLSVLEDYIDERIIGIVKAGSVQIQRTTNTGNTSIIEEIGPYEIFSTNINLYGDEIDAICVEEADIILIDYDYIIENINNDKQYFNQFIKNLFMIINDKIIEKNERIEILSKKSIRNKLLTFFDLEYKKRGSKYIYLPYNFKDLAEYLAIDRAAMSRELGYLRDEGFIETKSKRITLLNQRYNR